MIMDYSSEMGKGILWSFDNKKFNSQEEFIKVLLAYNFEIQGQDTHVDLDERILNSPKVVIQYSYWDEGEDDTLEPDFLLSADNSNYFTLGELLYKVHNEVYEKLSNDDHRFFEGFDLWKGENPNNPNVPLYFLQQGS